jgi:hypothetical protein
MMIATMMKVATITTFPQGVAHKSASAFFICYQF